MSYVSCSGSIRKDSSGNWWNCSTGFVERSDAEVVALLKADGVIEDAPEVGAVDLTLLVDALNQLFAFDPEVFRLVTASYLMLFVLGWGAGIIVKQLSRS